MHKYTFLISCSLLIATINAEQATRPTTIFDEARSGDRQAIRKRLENDEDCSKTEEGTGKTILHIAAENGDVEMIDIVTEEPDRSGFTNWFYYCWYNYPQLPDKDKQDENGDTAVHLSIAEGKHGATEKLFKKGVRTDLFNKQNYLPTFMILKKDNPALIPLLARYHCLDKKVKGETVLHKALKHNKPAITYALLREGSLVNEKDDKGRTLASIAAINNDVQALKTLITHNININAPDSNGARPIHHGAYYGNYDVVKFILENKGSDEVTDNEGNDLAHYAAKGSNKDILSLLFSYKVDIKKRNNKGEDAFLIAIDKGHWSFAHDLVTKYGFDVNSCDNKGKTALIRAIEEGKLETMHGLLGLGANLQITDHDKENGLHKAARLKDKKCAQIILSKNKSLLEAKNNRGETPLFVAVNEGYFDTVEVLIQAGATVNTENNDRIVPLLVAIERGNNYEKTINRLLQSGASLMVTDKNGNTAIHIAASKCKPEILSTILQQRNKPSIDMPNAAGLTPLHCAAQANNLPGMQMLEQYGASYTTKTPQKNSLAHSAMEKDAHETFAYIITRSPYFLNSVNENNEVPFIFGCRVGASTCIEKLLDEREDEFINGNAERGVQIAHRHGQYTTRDLVHKKIEVRKQLCYKIHDQYSTVVSLGNNNQITLNTLLQKDLSHVITWGTYAPSKPDYYTENQLYHMTEAQRNKIYNQYLKYENRERAIHTQFSDRLNAILSQEEADRIRAIAAQQERERIARLERERQDRERREREDAVQRALAEKKAQIAQKERELAAEQQRQDRELDPAAQQRDLDYYKQEKEKKDADAHRVEQQKQVAAAALQQKLWDDAQKHKQALQGQQPYTAMDLRPSAPAMEEEEEEEDIQHTQCIQCNGKNSTKPLPCFECRKKTHGNCNTCMKKNGGQCENCWKKIGKFTQKKSFNEDDTYCFLNQENTCKEKIEGVTKIPCDQCKNADDYICKACLEKYHSTHSSKKCPKCTADTINETLLQKILKQK